ARGGDLLLGAYNYLDLTPLGRQEEKGHGMDWVRYHDRYEARRRLGGRASRSASADSSTRQRTVRPKTITGN
ncbi:MAG: DUF899 family protein, partial [Chthoniobacterales bacterium]